MDMPSSSDSYDGQWDSQLWARPDFTIVDTSPLPHQGAVRSVERTQALRPIKELCGLG